MHLISYLHFFAFISYVYLSIYVFGKNPKSRLNQSCASFIACLAIWSFQNTILHSPWASLETAHFFVNIGVIGWVGFGGMFLGFVHIFTGQTSRLKKTWYRVLVILPAIVLIGQQWRGQIVVDYIQQPYGWAFVFPATIWPLVYSVYYLCIMSSALWILLRSVRTAQRPVMQKQARLMFSLGLTCVVMASISHAFLPMLRIYALPALGDVITLLWALGLSYSILKHNFLTISPATAADNIISTMSDLLVLTNPHGRIVTVNQAALDLLGYKRRDMENRSLMTFIHASSMTHDRFEKHFGAGPISNQRIDLKTASGGSISAMVSGSMLADKDDEPVGMVFVAKDITSLVEADQALRESEEQYRDLVENINDVIYMLDPQGKIAYISPRIEALTGHQHTELIGSALIDLALAEDRSSLQQRLKLGLDGQNVGTDCRLLKKDKKIVWVHVSLRPVIENKCVTGLQGMLTDIDDRIQAISERQELEARLHKSQKMEAIGNLAGGMAHDLNNILSGVVSYPELILLDLPNDSALMEPLKIIKSSGEKAVAIVQDLLTLARRNVPSFEPVNLNLIIRAYLKSPEHKHQHAFNPLVTVSENLDQELLNIEGSKVHLTSTVMNLMNNAFEAMPNGGKITISTQNRYVDLPIAGYEDVIQGDYAVLTVKDEGISIGQTDLDRIFEPFYTKKVMGRSGSGLGMAVVWGTVKDHQGYIDIRSTEGQGTVFELYFPVTEAAQIKPKKDVSLEHLRGDNETILLIDDIFEQRVIGTSILRKLGYEVNSVDSGEKALEYLRHQPVDLLVLDMIMGTGMDGLDTFQAALEINPRQKAIIASGFSETERVKQTLDLGASKYLKKPYTMEKIGLAVRTALYPGR